MEEANKNTFLLALLKNKMGMDNRKEKMNQISSKKLPHEAYKNTKSTYNSALYSLHMHGSITGLCLASGKGHYKKKGV